MANKFVAVHMANFFRTGVSAQSPEAQLFNHVRQGRIKDVENLLAQNRVALDCVGQENEDTPLQLMRRVHMPWERTCCQHEELLQAMNGTVEERASLTAHCYSIFLTEAYSRKKFAVAR